MWHEPMPAYGKLPEVLIATRETSRKLWAFMLRQHPVPPRFVVFAGTHEGDRRPHSTAMACADALSYPRKEVFVTPTGLDDSVVGGEPPNRHAYEMLRQGRHGIRG